MVTRHDDLTTVLRDPETYSSARALPVVLPVAEEALAVVAKGRPQLPDVVQSDGEAHARMRAPLAAALRPDRVAAMEPALRERAVALAAAVREGGGRAELMTAYAIPLTQAAIGLLCGFDEELAVRTYSLMDSLVRLGSQRQTEPEQMASAEAGAELAAVVARLLRERRAAPGDDAFSLVAASMAEGDRPLTPLEEAEAVGNLMQLVIAGQVTTAPLLGGAVALLLGERGGEEWRRIAADRSLVPAAVEELVRLVAPASGLYRETTRPVTLGGVDLPEGPGWCCATTRPAATRRSTTGRTSWTSAAARTGTSPSAGGRTTASAPRWPGCSSPSPWRCCRTRCPACGSPRRSRCAPPWTYATPRRCMSPGEAGGGNDRGLE
ncbi:hypothetical protein [Thermocatellispora tengchongensis]